MNRPLQTARQKKQMGLQNSYTVFFKSWRKLRNLSILNGRFRGTPISNTSLIPDPISYRIISIVYALIESPAEFGCSR